MRSGTGRSRGRGRGRGGVERERGFRGGRIALHSISFLLRRHYRILGMRGLWPRRTFVEGFTGRRASEPWTSRRLTEVEAELVTARVRTVCCGGACLLWVLSSLGDEPSMLSQVNAI